MLDSRRTATLLFVLAVSASSSPRAPAEAANFLRADANGDGRLDLSDAVYTLAYLFSGGGEPACHKAVDANDSGVIDLSDAIFTLGFLFLGETPPPSPGVECGPDSTLDALSCAAFSACPQPTVPAHPLRFDAGGAPAQFVLGGGEGVIYCVTREGDLLWYRDVHQNGTPGWDGASGARVGNGWFRMRHVFSGGNGVIYAIRDNGDLHWYRDAAGNGTRNWAAGSGNRIGSGWIGFRHVFSGGGGVIYAIRDNGDLHWYHDAAQNGSPGWAAGSGNLIGSGWLGYRQVFSGGNGMIYAVHENGDLFWYQDLAGNGTPGWHFSSGGRIGSGWNMLHAFSGGGGAIYAVTASGELIWYRDAHQNGTPGWDLNSGNLIGSGWARVGHVLPLRDFEHGSMTVNGRPAIGARPLLVILAQYDNDAQDTFPPFAATHPNEYYDKLAFGSPRAPFSTRNPINPASLSAYFRECSAGRFEWTTAGRGVVGPIAMGSLTSDPGPEARSAAIIAAAAERRLVRFSDFDANGDFFVGTDELGVLVVENIRGLQPANRRSNAVSIETLPLLSLTVQVDVAFAGPFTPFFQIAHEVSHSLGTRDLYGAGNYLLTLLGAYPFFTDDQATVHLDAWHTMKLGWVEPRRFRLETPGETLVPLTHGLATSAPIILHDGDTGAAEYFLLERRSPASLHGLAYDAQVAGDGLAIWRIRHDQPIPAVHLSSPDLAAGGNTVWSAGELTPVLSYSDGRSTGTCVRAGATQADGSVRVTWWNDRFPLLVYSSTPGGDLHWHRHNGFLVGAGAESWEGGHEVGSGWNELKHVFTMGAGIVYAIHPGGELRWYRHQGYRDGGGVASWQPADTGHRVVGQGWQDVRLVFAAGAGIIYAVMPGGELRWYKHNGYQDGGGPATWYPQDTGYRVVGAGWQDIRLAMAAERGIVYAVNSAGDLVWLRHAGHEYGGGVETWEPQDTSFKVVGRGWGGIRQMFYGGEGIIYAIASNGELRWYQHSGYLNGGGLDTWHPQDTGHRVVGTGWGGSQHVFCMRP